MKTLEKISKGLMSQISHAHLHIGNEENWDFYHSISGFSKKNEDLYISVFLQIHKLTKTKKILIDNLTDEPLEVLNIIKSIAPNAKVTYYEKNCTYKKITK